VADAEQILCSRCRPASCVVIADELFDGKAWTVSVHTRANGTRFYQLTELAGARTDWPRLSESGVVEYDGPDVIPFAVKAWVRKMLVEHEQREKKP
jgi:hypothetical protein